MKNIAIFASGEGSNAQNIIDYFKSSQTAMVSLILSNKPEANVLNRAKNAGIEQCIITHNNFHESGQIIELLKENEIDWIILAGFLWLIPENLIKAFPNRIINIHPALLPKYGGKGMYGMRVHEAVIEAKEKESGITIHYVDGEYDKGKIIIQVKCTVEPDDTPQSLADKIHMLEKQYFPKTIETLL
jgi:phosphoribosylglycinamide formyltransferase-1